MAIKIAHLRSRKRTREVHQRVMPLGRPDHGQAADSPVMLQVELDFLPKPGRTPSFKFAHVKKHANFLVLLSQCLEAWSESGKILFDKLPLGLDYDRISIAHYLDRHLQLPSPRLLRKMPARQNPYPSRFRVRARLGPAIGNAVLKAIDAFLAGVHERGQEVLSPLKGTASARTSRQTHTERRSPDEHQRPAFRDKERATRPLHAMLNSAWADPRNPPPASPPSPSATPASAPAALRAP